MIARWFIQEPKTAAIAPQSWSFGSCGKGLPVASLDFGLVVDDDLAPVLGLEVGVERVALAVLVMLENVLEIVAVDVEHDVANTSG